MGDLLPTVATHTIMQIIACTYSCMYNTHTYTVQTQHTLSLYHHQGFSICVSS